MIIKSGPQNTDELLRVVKDRLKTQAFDYVTIASKTGEVGLRAVRDLSAVVKNMVVVGRSYGFTQPNQPEFLEDNRKKIEDLGAKVLTGSMVFSGVNDSYRAQGIPLVQDVIKQALERIGIGVTIAVDNVMRACDAALVPHRVDVLALTGDYDWEKEGLDTAVIVKSANTRRFLDLKVREILYKPMHW
jgi:hypothetical protein